MGIYVDLVNGKVTSRYSLKQYEGQTYYADGSPELAGLLLSDEIEKKCDAVDALHAVKQHEGFVFEGHRFEIDSGSQGKIGNLALRAALAAMGTPGISWMPLDFVTADNTIVTFATPAPFLPFANAAADAAQALFARRTALKFALRAAASAEALAAIDIATGWPVLA